MCECLSRVEMSGLFLLKLEIFGFLDPARVDLSRVEGQDVSEVTNNIFRELMEVGVSKNCNVCIAVFYYYDAARSVKSTFGYLMTSLMKILQLSAYQLH
ncbi:unnamed protein product [Allacma fusca]|uniref:Uncharacterized protein n=1 Tax=Allacma fusca TaxID=39272 RepID=A0A8J2P080_9HEXA|nr:unnamed protein product [Allacma fusca]